VRKLLFVILAAMSSLSLAAPAVAHGGGLDSNGGHYCRAAGAKSKKCGPVNSYHCHRAGCKPRR
jgi:hypothetical protein